MAADGGRAGQVAEQAGEGGPAIPAGVGRTAVSVADVRAVESRRPDRLFDDPYASAFLARDPVGATRFDAIPAELEEVARHIVVRTRFFDDFLLAAAEAGCRQFVLLGAGLDMRAYRLGLPPGSVCYELDTPEVFGFKDGVIREVGARPIARRVTVPADLREDWTAALTGFGFVPMAPSAWLLEGLLLYLRPDQAELTLERVDELAALGSRLALTHGFDPRNGLPADRLHPELATVDALWRGGLTQDPLRWLEEHRWQSVWHDRASVAASYGRAGYLGACNSFVTSERRPAASDDPRSPACRVHDAPNEERCR